VEAGIGEHGFIYTKGWPSQHAKGGSKGKEVVPNKWDRMLPAVIFYL